MKREQSAVAVYGELVHVGAVRKFPLAVHPFDPIRSKIFFSRSAVRPYPFENYSSSVQPFDLIRSKIFFIRSAVRPHPFENFLHPFSRSLLSVSNGLPTRFSSVRLPCVRPFERIPLGTFSRERSQSVCKSLFTFDYHRIWCKC